MILFVGHRLEDPDGEQFLVTIYDDGTASFATKPTRATPRWSPPEPLVEEPVQ